MKGGPKSSLRPFLHRALHICMLCVVDRRFYNLQFVVFLLRKSCPRGGGGLPYIKGRDARREISNEPLKGTNLGVA